ncbi:MAG: hypothetical protein RLZZ573_1841 [Pseudomonadota bacterium]
MLLIQQSRLAAMGRMEEKATRITQRMSSTIDEFRNFYKPEKISTALSLLQSMTAVGDIMEATLKNHNIQPRIECDEGTQLTGVSGALSQVWLNLISNSKDALIEPGQKDTPHHTARRAACRPCVRPGGGQPRRHTRRADSPNF